MDKQEQYEAVLKHLAMTGQGVPADLLKFYPEYDWSLTEELIEEGKLAIAPGWEDGPDHLIIADDRYYRTEIEDPKVAYIECMRHYLGIMEDDEQVAMFDISIKEIIETNRERYDQWLEKSRSKLDALIELKKDLIEKGSL